MGISRLDSGVRAGVVVDCMGHEYTLLFLLGHGCPLVGKWNVSVVESHFLRMLRVASRGTQLACGLLRILVWASSGPVLVLAGYRVLALRD
ncbi:hypothetical protein Tco_1577653 [Tanacetum coccineum]